MQVLVLINSKDLTEEQMDALWDKAKVIASPTGGDWCIHRPIHSVMEDDARLLGIIRHKAKQEN